MAGDARARKRRRLHSAERRRRKRAAESITEQPWCCSDFGDQISSVTIVGFPEGPRLQLRDCANWPWCDQHNIWTFQVKAGRFVASLSDLGSDFSDKADELIAIT